MKKKLPMMRRALVVFMLLALLTGFSACSTAPDNIINSADDMDGAAVGILRGTTTTNYVTNLFNDGAIVSSYDDRDELLNALTSGRIDCVVMDNDITTAFLRRSTRITMLPEPYTDDAYSIVIAKENADLTAEVNAAIAQLQLDGTISKILTAYISGGSYAYTSTLKEEDARGTLTLAVDTSVTPFAYYDEEGNITGLDVDICTAICDILGVKLVVVSDYASNLMTLVAKGQADMAMSCFVDNETDRQLVDFSDSYYATTQMIIVRK